MKLSAAIASLTALGMVSAAAVSDRDAKSDQQRDFDNQTKDFKNRDLCRHCLLVNPDPSYSKVTDLCKPACGDARKIVGCVVEGTTQQPRFRDPQGLPWQIGECKCK
jgi:hypothetical protein